MHSAASPYLAGTEACDADVVAVPSCPSAFFVPPRLEDDPFAFVRNLLGPVLWGHASVGDLEARIENLEGALFRLRSETDSSLSGENERLQQEVATELKNTRAVIRAKAVVADGKAAANAVVDGVDDGRLIGLTVDVALRGEKFGFRGGLARMIKTFERSHIEFFDILQSGVPFSVIRAEVEELGRYIIATRERQIQQKYDRIGSWRAGDVEKNHALCIENRNFLELVTHALVQLLGLGNVSESQLWVEELFTKMSNLLYLLEQNYNALVVEIAKQLPDSLERAIKVYKEQLLMIRISAINVCSPKLSRRTDKIFEAARRQNMREALVGGVVPLDNQVMKIGRTVTGYYFNLEGFLAGYWRQQLNLPREPSVIVNCLLTYGFPVLAPVTAVVLVACGVHRYLRPPVLSDGGIAQLHDSCAGELADSFFDGAELRAASNVRYLEGKTSLMPFSFEYIVAGLDGGVQAEFIKRVRDEIVARRDGEFYARLAADFTEAVDGAVVVKPTKDGMRCEFDPNALEESYIVVRGVLPPRRFCELVFGALSSVAEARGRALKGSMRVAELKMVALWDLVSGDKHAIEEVREKCTFLEGGGFKVNMMWFLNAVVADDAVFKCGAIFKRREQLQFRKTIYRWLEIWPGEESARAEFVRGSQEHWGTYWARTEIEQTPKLFYKHLTEWYRIIDSYLPDQEGWLPEVAAWRAKNDVFVAKACKGYSDRAKDLLKRKFGELDNGGIRVAATQVAIRDFRRKVQQLISDLRAASVSPLSELRRQHKELCKKVEELTDNLAVALSTNDKHNNVGCVRDQADGDEDGQEESGSLLGDAVPADYLLVISGVDPADVIALVRREIPLLRIGDDGRFTFRAAADNAIVLEKQIVDLYARVHPGRERGAVSGRRRLADVDLQFTEIAEMFLKFKNERARNIAPLRAFLRADIPRRLRQEDRRLYYENLYHLIMLHRGLTDKYERLYRVAVGAKPSDDHCESLWRRIVEVDCDQPSGDFAVEWQKLKGVVGNYTGDEPSIYAILADCVESKYFPRVIDFRKIELDDIKLRLDGCLDSLYGRVVLMRDSCLHTSFAGSEQKMVENFFAKFWSDLFRAAKNIMTILSTATTLDSDSPRRMLEAEMAAVLDRQDERMRHSVEDLLERADQRDLRGQLSAALMDAYQRSVYRRGLWGGRAHRRVKMLLRDLRHNRAKPREAKAILALLINIMEAAYPDAQDLFNKIGIGFATRAKIIRFHLSDREHSNVVRRILSSDFYRDVAARGSNADQFGGAMSVPYEIGGAQEELPPAGPDELHVPSGRRRLPPIGTRLIDDAADAADAAGGSRYNGW